MLFKSNDGSSQFHDFDQGKTAYNWNLGEVVTVGKVCYDRVPKEDGRR